PMTRHWWRRGWPRSAASPITWKSWTTCKAEAGPARPEQFRAHAVFPARMKEFQGKIVMSLLRSAVAAVASILPALAASAQDFNATPPNAPDQRPAFEGQTRAPVLTDDF